MRRSGSGAVYAHITATQFKKERAPGGEIEAVMSPGAMASTAKPIFVLSAFLVLGIGCAKPPAPGDPLPGLDADQRRRFETGRQIFERTFTPRDRAPNATRHLHPVV
jgi:hypothetical protein